MKYQYWLSNIPGVGCKTIHRLLGQAGSAEEIYFLKKECSFIDGKKGKGYTYSKCEKKREGKK